MKTLLYIFALTFIIGSMSCRKKDKDEGLLLSGTIIDDCSGTPLANFHLILDVEYNCLKIGKPCHDTYYFDSDANGNFSVDLDKKGNVAHLRAYHSGTSILKGIPTKYKGKEFHIGSFIARPTTSFVYRIKVNNPYNVGDTLQLSIYHGAYRIKIPAPLSDTTFPQVDNYANIKPLYYENISNNIVTIEGLYDVTKGGLTYEDIIKRELFSFALPACPSMIDTITININ